MEQQGVEQESGCSDDAGDRVELLIRLYEGAIDFFNRAVAGLSAGDQEAFRQLLQRGRAIILEFQRTLDFTQGGELAKQLNQLYDFMLDQLKIAEERLDPKPVEQVLIAMNNLLDGWRTVYSNKP